MLLIAKPSGPTSRAAVDAVVRALGTRRVGHAGTLDPFADGLLIVAWEKATALLTYIQAQSKAYVANVRFGRVTDTQDRTGRVLAERDPGALTADVIREGLGPFRGTIDQVPPMYSAVKSCGERLYDIARRGETRERVARTREVHALELIDWYPPFARLRVVCSSGTYVRTLAHDLGETLGTGACLETLTRTDIGPFRLAEAVALDRLIERGAEEILNRAISPADALPDWGAITVSDGESREVMCGSWRDPDRRASPGERFRVLDGRGRLLALVRGGDSIEYLRVLEAPETVG